MRKTYAHNSIIIGFLVGALVYAKAGMGAGIVVGIIVTVVGWLIIRGIENAMYSGIDAIDNAVNRNQNYNMRSHNVNLTLKEIRSLSDDKNAPWECPDCGEINNKEAIFCKSCGKYK